MKVKEQSQTKRQTQFVVRPIIAAGLAIIDAKDDAAAEWLAVNCPPITWPHYGGVLGVRQEHIGKLMDAMRKSGFAVQVGKAC